MASHCPSLKLAEGSLHNLQRYSKALSCKTHTPKVNSTVNSLTPLWEGDPLLYSNLNVMKTAQSIKHIRIRRIVSRIGWVRLNLYRFVCHYDKGCFHIQPNPFRAFLQSWMLMTNLEIFVKITILALKSVVKKSIKSVNSVVAKGFFLCIISFMSENHRIRTPFTGLLGLLLLLRRKAQ